MSMEAETICGVATGDIVKHVGEILNETQDPFNVTVKGVSKLLEEKFSLETGALRDHRATLRSMLFQVIKSRHEKEEAAKSSSPDESPAPSVDQATNETCADDDKTKTDKSEVTQTIDVGDEDEDQSDNDDNDDKEASKKEDDVVLESNDEVENAEADEEEEKEESKDAKEDDEEDDAKQTEADEKDEDEDEEKEEEAVLESDGEEEPAKDKPSAKKTPSKNNKNKKTVKKPKKKDSQEEEEDDEEQVKTRKSSKRKRYDSDEDDEPPRKRRRRSSSSKKTPQKVDPNKLTKSQFKLYSKVEELKKVIRGCGFRVTGITPKMDFSDQIKYLKKFIKKEGMSKDMTVAEMEKFKHKREQEKEIEFLLSPKIARQTPKGKRATRNTEANYQTMQVLPLGVEDSEPSLEEEDSDESYDG